MTTTGASATDARTGRVAVTWRGLYINLDRSTSRRAAIVAQLAAVGLAGRYARLPATDGRKLTPTSPLKPGEVGCFASHMAAVDKAARATGLTHILEDDAVLSPLLPAAVVALEARGVFRDYDLVFTETMVSPNLHLIKTLKAEFDAATVDSTPPAIVDRLQVMDLAQTTFACASSYILTPAGAARLAPLLRQEWEAGPAVPFDLALRREAHARRIHAGCVFPFVTSVDFAEVAKSTLGRDDPPDPVLIFALLRYAFVVGHDLAGPAAALLADLEARADATAPAADRRFLAAVLGLIVSDRFRLV